MTTARKIFLCLISIILIAAVSFGIYYAIWIAKIPDTAKIILAAALLVAGLFASVAAAVSGKATADAEELQITRSIIDSSSDLIAAVSRGKKKRRIIFVNTAFRTASGTSRNSELSQDCSKSQILTAEDVDTMISEAEINGISSGYTRISDNTYRVSSRMDERLRAVILVFSRVSGAPSSTESDDLLEMEEAALQAAEHEEEMSEEPCDNA